MHKIIPTSRKLSKPQIQEKFYEVKMSEFACEICEKKFNNKSNLQGHYNTVHNYSGKLHNCNMCTKSLKSRGNLVSHIKTVHGGNYHSCYSCGRSFSQVGALRIHIHTVLKATKITNANIVKNYFLEQHI